MGNIVNKNSPSGPRPTVAPQEVTLLSIFDAFQDLLKPVDGDLNVTVSRVCSQDNPLTDAIVFVGDEIHLLKILESPVTAIVVHEKLTQLAQAKNKNKKVILSTNNSYLSMAQINARFFSLPFLKAPFDNERIHKTAVISEYAKLGENVIVGPCAVISAHVIIGNNTFIGAHTMIESYSSIGENCFIHPQVNIGHTCRIGNRVEIKPHSTVGSDGFGYAHDKAGNHYRISHYGTVIIEDDVHIGANVNIDRGTFDPAIIGAGTKIDNYCHLGHNIKVGKNCLITAGFISAGSVTIGDNCVFGGRATVNGHISIVSGCTFGGLSGINKSVTKPGMYAGYPTVDYRESLKIQMTSTKLPQIRKNLNLIMKKLGLDPLEKDSE